MLGFDRMPALLKEAGRKSPDENIKHFKLLQTHGFTVRQQDDMTFVVFKEK